MKWVVAIIMFVILSSIIDSFNQKARELEERVSKLEEVLKLYQSDDGK